jgi:hypothetical protein
MIRIQSNRKTKNQPQSLSNTAPRIKASTQSKSFFPSIIRKKNKRFLFFSIGLDNLDQNIPGFSDDTLGNDGDGDSLTKSKLNLNSSKDKKKPFFKKVNTIR